MGLPVGAGRGTDDAPRRLRLTTRSIVLSVLAFGLTVVVVRTAIGSFRVLGWIVAAMSVAGLLHPAVNLLARRIPKGFAVLAVAVGTLGFIGLVGYGLINGIVHETREVQEAAPAWATKVEHSHRFGELARDAHLAERVKKAVDAIPERLRGGTAADAIKSAASRGVAFLATGVLTLFFLLHGPKLAGAALAQVAEGERRDELEDKIGRGVQRGFGYARWTLVLAVLAGLFGFALAHWAGAPGAAPLAFWVALWDIVPLAGFVIGAMPIVVLGGIGHPGWHTAALIVAFLAYQVAEVFIGQRFIERRTVKLGAFLTAAAAFAGLELYGIGGALALLLGAALAVGVADELAPD